jgi:hypothetical protein
VGGLSKTKRSWWIGIHRYKADELVFDGKMDHQIREGDEDLFSILLRKKYLKGRSFFSSNS